MMKMRTVAAIGLAGLLTITACSGEGGVEDVVSGITEDSVADQVEQDAMELAAEVEQEMTVLGEEIRNSGAAAELQAAWDEVQAEASAAIASMQTDGTIQAEGLRTELEEFQAELEAAGDEVGPELQDAWESLRAKIEQLMS